MKKQTLWSLLWLSLLAAVCIPSVAGVQPPLRIEPRPAHALLVVGGAPQSYTAVRLLFRGGAELPFTNPVIWSSSNQNVMTVNAQGVVT